MFLKVRGMSLSVFCVLWIFFVTKTLGEFDPNLTLQNTWGRLPSQNNLRSTISCISGDGNANAIKFSRKINTGQGPRLPKRSQLVLQRKPTSARVFLMPADDKLNRFGAFQCRLNRQGVYTEIVTLKLPPEGVVELDAVEPYIVVNQGDEVQLQVVVQKKLNVTLKWRHNGQDEIAEWDDKVTIELKNVQESDGGVYECYYEGRRSESVHAILRLIVRACPAEFYGENCTEECPPCYNGGICHDKWGVCVCPAGFTGENCEEACGGNHFGADCRKQCTPPQGDISMDEGCALHLFCKPDPYGCSCAPGFKGPKCMDHCKSGWYGADCKQKCHCFYGHSSCNRITGACEGGCARGWRGISCQIEDPDATPGSLTETTTMAICPLGHYGPSCEKDCHCNGNEFCDVISGQCPSGCQEGWGGSSCSECVLGRFGENCESTCHCEGGDRSCDHDGYCLSGCEAGWAGFTCQQECNAGRFGPNCASVCHCLNGTCDIVTGICDGDCRPGYMGKDCQTMCPHNTYGVNCIHTCTCLNGGQCSRIDGKCSCEGRWRGTICNENEPQIIAANDDEVNVGQLAFISCTVDAIPEPVMNITSDNFPQLSFDFRKLEKNQYQGIAKARSYEEGEIDFTCTARNPHGYDTKIITLAVIGPPRLLVEPNLQSSTNTTLEISWKEWEYGEDEGGKSDDVVEYMRVYRKTGSSRWVKADSWKSDRFSLIEDLEPDTVYQVAVKCRRPGKGGEGTPSPYMNVKTDCGEPLPDAIPRQFIPETISSSSAKLTWQHPSEVRLKCTLIGYRLEYHLERTPSDRTVLDIPDTTNEIELHNLTSHSAYVLRLFPMTPIGHGKYFAELIFNTAESIPSAVSDLMVITTETADELVITWNEPSTGREVIKGYIVSYQIINRGLCDQAPSGQTGNAEIKSVFSTDTQLRLVNLYPYSTYLVTVEPKTSAGEGSAMSATGITAEGSPDIGPPNLRLVSNTSTTLGYKWDSIPCELANGEIVDYEYKLVTSDSNELSHPLVNKRFKEESPDDALKNVKDREVVVSGLEPNTEYGFAVRGNTDAGVGPFTEFLFARTTEGVPDPVINLTCNPTEDPKELVITWKEPLVTRGSLKGYLVSYQITKRGTCQEISKDQDSKVQSVSPPHTQLRLKNLHPYSRYLVTVKAQTSAGNGNDTSAKGITAVGVPDIFPPNVRLTSKTTTTLEFKWDPIPCHQANGEIVDYEYELVRPESRNVRKKRHEGKTFDNSLKKVKDLKATIIDLEPNNEYRFTVRANTKSGSGPFSEYLFVLTEKEEVEIVAPHVEAIENEAINGSIPIVFSTAGKSSVRKYQIIVEDSRNSQDIDENLLYDYESAVVKEGLPYYITAELDPSNVSDSGEQKFVVGDRKVWGGYKNVHLNPGHEYRIRIRTLIDNGQGTKYLLSDPKEEVLVPLIKVYSQKDEHKIFGIDLLVFILILVGVLVFLIIIIFLVCVYACRKKERRKVSKSERNSGISESMTWSVMYKVSENEAVDGPLVSEGYKVMHGTENGMSLKKVKKDSKTSIGIKIENFPEYVHNATSGTRLSDEFTRLAAGQTAPWTVARKSENLKKNRYGNILPYDRHRVVLHFDQNGSGSDYINASYVDGYRRPKEYIVTQGPLENTVVDFWRMVWQESVPVIVMVTELVENGKKKCVQYWPDDSMVCGKLQILLIHSEQNTNFVIRTILIRSMEEGRTHRVHQYQYTDWPDRTIPLNPCFLIKMMKRIRNDHPVFGGPMVVHCSSGSGRSGTYLAFDAVTQQAEEEKRVDIFRCVNCARLQRINLVQTSEQYVFIHEALLDAIQYEDTSIPLEKIQLYLKELENSHSQEHISTIQRQFEMLNRSQKRVDINQCSDAFSECNIFKNRDPIIVPADSQRIRLQSDTKQDYINAVKVNGYGRKDAFLVTQMPLQDTIEDFWLLVHQHNSSLILMLNGCDADDFSNIGQYWPVKGQATYGHFEVQLVTFEDQGEVIIRVLRLLNHDKPKDEPHKIIQLQYKAWKSSLPPGPSSMLNLLNTVELWYSRSSGGPITVHCLDGATRSGMFCAVSYACSQLKAEGLLDAYQMVKDIRINRPEFVPNLDQYRFCFQVAQELAVSIEETNNRNTLTRKKLSCYV